MTCDRLTISYCQLVSNTYSVTNAFVIAHDFMLQFYASPPACLVIPYSCVGACYSLHILACSICSVRSVHTASINRMVQLLIGYLL